MQSYTRKLKDGAELLYAWFEAMHTRIDLMMWASGDRAALMEEAAGGIEREVLRIESFGSCFLPDSEVSRFNDTPPGIPFHASDELFHIIKECLKYNDQTDGLFDVAASSDFPDFRLNEKIFLDPESSSIVRAFDWVRLNLSGFLKGYALDRAVVMARSSGLSDGLFSFGNSSISAFGNHPGGSGWPVSPAGDKGDVHVLFDQSLTTSGNATEARRHIIDPLTGTYVEGCGTFSVMTGSAAEGEALSTAGFIRSMKNGTR